LKSFRVASGDLLTTLKGCASSQVAAPNRKAPIPHDISVHRRRHKIENMFGRLKVSNERILGRGAFAPPDQHSE
jgi:hypothetical protein